MNFKFFKCVYMSNEYEFVIHIDMCILGFKGDFM